MAHVLIRNMSEHAFCCRMVLMLGLRAAFCAARRSWPADAIGAIVKLSNEKIDQLTEDLIDRLAEVDGVMFRGDDSQIRLAARQIIIDELSVEEQLDAEIHRMLQSHKYEITMGRMKYDELFKKAKAKLVAERKLVL